MNREQDNFKAGLFVLAGLILGIVVVFLLSDFKRFTEKQQEIQAFFSLADGLQGLKVGSLVTLGDQPVGSVVGIEDATKFPAGAGIDAATEPSSKANAAGIPIVGVTVTIRIPKRYDIFDDAVFEVVAPPLGNGTKLNIRSVGMDTQHPYVAGKPIRGSLAGSVLTENFTKNLGVRDLQRKQIQQIIANVNLITKALTVSPGEMPEGMKPLPVQVTLDHLQEITKQFKDDLPRMISELNKALADLKSTTSDAKAVLAQIKEHSPQWIEKVDGTLANAKETSARINKFVEEKDDKFRNIVDDTQQIAKTIREKTLAQVTEALDKGTLAMENFKALSSDGKNLLSTQRPVLERALANAQLTTEQLKLASIEIRRSPWRLLYKPTEQELDSDNLYDAARSYALAAGTLDAAAVSLRAATNDPSTDKKQIQIMLDYLEKVFAKYQDAENKFWKALGNK